MDRSRLRARLTELVRQHSVPGVQLAIHHDDHTWTWQTGVARQGVDAPMTATSAVPSGSLTKVVTAAVVMALVSEGDLDLDEPLAEQVPDLRLLPSSLRETLTLRHVLSHTAGLPSDGLEVGNGSVRRYVLDSCRSLIPLAEPGSVFSYSNLGYLIAGHAIESATGLTWAEAVRAIVLDPLRIQPRFVVGAGATADLVTGHTVNRAMGTVRAVSQSVTATEAAAGALAFSAADLLVLGRALAGHDPELLLDPGSLKEMRVSVAGADPFGMADGWGLGLASFGAGSGATTGHDGTGDGTSCHLRMNSATGTVVALTANAGTGFALWREFAAELADCGVPVQDYDALPTMSGRQPAPTDCLGDFANGDTVYSVQRSEAGLRLTVDTEPFADLTPLTGLRFAMRDCDTGETDQMGRFVPAADGRIGWLQVGGRLARRLASVRVAA
ncbi:MAG: serine hydrolase [Actinomycetota bacterium]|nr:serine hydrolase [Actinomycetota bacterium]